MTEATVEAIADEEFRVMAAGDVSAFLRLLAPDAAFFPPNEPPKKGSAIAPWISEFLGAFTVEFQQHAHEDVVVTEGWAVLRTAFAWRVEPRGGGDVVVRRGNTVRFFRQDDTNAWKLAREIWTTYAVA